MSSVSQARPIPFAAGALVANAGNFCGITISETAGAVAYVKLFDNPSAASGTIIATIKLPAAGSLNIPPSGGSVYFATGLFAQIVSGTVEGSVYIG